MRLLLTILIVLTPFAAQARPMDLGPDGHHWAIYSNVRYEYRICYPDDLMVAQGEADNSDGQTFLARAGDAKLVAYGSMNAADKSLRNAADDAAKNLSKVKYKRVTNDWFAVSGTKDDKIVYTKTMLVNGQFATFELTYNRGSAATYNPLIGTLLKCFETRLPKK